MQNLTEYIAAQPKTTPVTVYLWQDGPVTFPNCRVFCGAPGYQIVFGDWKDIEPVLETHKESIRHAEVTCACRNRAVPLLDIRGLHARIEPGAIIREKVIIGDCAVIMMGAVLNIGAQVGAESMIDMNAVLGARATVGKRCHIGAGAVLAGVIEPPSATPVVVEDDVLVGANAVVLEGCRIGAGAVVAAGSVVTRDVPPDAVVAGAPAKIIKWKDSRTAEKTVLAENIRQL